MCVSLLRTVSTWVKSGCKYYISVLASRYCILDSSSKPNSNRAHGVLKEEAKAAEIMFQKVLSLFWECHNTYSTAKTMTDVKVTHFSMYTRGCRVLQLQCQWLKLPLYIACTCFDKSITKVPSWMHTWPWHWVYMVSRVLNLSLVHSMTRKVCIVSFLI